MEGKKFFTIGGLLLAQAILAYLMSTLTEHFLIEIVISVWFLMVLAIFISIAFEYPLHAHVMVSFAFVVALLNAVYLSFINMHSWLVVMLSLGAAGFLFSISHIKARRVPARVRKHYRKELLDKELPIEPPATVEVYETPKRTVKKKRVTKKTVKKTTKKKTAKKKTARKKSTSSKTR